MHMLLSDYYYIIIWQTDDTSAVIFSTFQKDTPLFQNQLVVLPDADMYK